MFTIRKATTADCALIQKLAQQIFPVTYKDILTPEQTDYMMEWMLFIGQYPQANGRGRPRLLPGLRRM